MTELDEIKTRTKPDEVLLVCDAMAGQDTVRTASEFNRRLDISGFIMTKLDGDARGGAALSIKEITGKPIKFLGTGEDLDRLEVFRAEGLASRILGMGDVVGLMKDFESVVDERQAERDTKKLLKGQFTLEDFLNQIKTLQKLGSVKELYEKFPLFGDAGLPDGAQLDESAFQVMESIIQSMTPKERAEPAIIDKSRAERIAKGAGRKVEQVNDLLSRFSMMHTMMQNLATQPGLLANLPGFKQLAQVRGLKGKGMGDILGKPSDAIRAMARANSGGSMPGMGMPGLPGMPASSSIPGLPGGMPTAGVPQGALPPGIPQEQYAQMLQAQQGMGQARPRAPVKDKAKNKAKRKAARKARKRGRKR